MLNWFTGSKFVPGLVELSDVTYLNRYPILTPNCSRFLKTEPSALPMVRFSDSLAGLFEASAFSLVNEEYAEGLLFDGIDDYVEIEPWMLGGPLSFEVSLTRGGEVAA